MYLRENAVLGMLHLGELSSGLHVNAVVCEFNSNEPTISNNDWRILGNLNSFLRFLVSLIKESKDKLKQKFKDNCISVLKKTIQGRQTTSPS